MSGTDKPHGLRRLVADETFHAIEHGLYVALAAVLSVTAIAALLQIGYTLFVSLYHGSGGSALLEIIDQLLFVLMLAEILHTVRVSIRSGALTGEPFLIVGLIASIRRVLVITLESSQSSPGKNGEGGHEAAFQSSMVELGVLAGLILVMVISIYLIRRSTDGGQSVSTDTH